MSSDDKRQELKQTIRSLRGKLARVHDKLDRADRDGQQLRKQLERMTRRVAVPEILPGIVRQRRAAFPPSGLRESAAAREREFIAASPSYAEPSPLHESDVLTEIGHISLWLPARFVNKVDFPWSLIQRVRSVVVGGIMLDIGANVGQTSVPRVLLGDFQAVYAAEPEPGNYARLKATIAANGLSGFVLPDRVAIGSRDGTLRFKIGHYRSASAAAGSDRKTIEVPSLTLDAWVERLGIARDTISFVKTDTNGCETEVLRGADRLLSRRLAAWQIEVAPAAMQHLGTNIEMLTGELKRHFSHFIDLSMRARGEVVRSTGELPDALEYLGSLPTSGGGKPPQTDLLCFNC